MTDTVAPDVVNRALAALDARRDVMRGGLALKVYCPRCDRPIGTVQAWNGAWCWREHHRYQRNGPQQQRHFAGLIGLDSPTPARLPGSCSRHGVWAVPTVDVLTALGDGRPKLTPKKAERLHGDYPWSLEGAGNLATYAGFDDDELPAALVRSLPGDRLRPMRN